MKITDVTLALGFSNSSGRISALERFTGTEEEADAEIGRRNRALETAGKLSPGHWFLMWLHPATPKQVPLPFEEDGTEPREYDHHGDATDD